MTGANLELLAQLPIARELLAAKGWDSVMRQLMLAGRTLNVLPEADRNDSNYVQGCESDVWLKVELCNGKTAMQAYSPSKIIRGVLAVIAERVAAMDSASIANFDFDGYMQKLGLQRYLSQSRGNGIRQVIAVVKDSHPVFGSDPL